MPAPTRSPCSASDGGFALVMTSIALGLLSLLGIYLGLIGSGEVRIGDNYEGELRARYAALSGIAHTRVLLRGLDFDRQLIGPDGLWDNRPDYLVQARQAAFRNPIPRPLALRVDVVDPTPDLISIPDDGLLSSGCPGPPSCAILIPRAGIAFRAPGPDGIDRPLSRYFVKVTDNNGEASEVKADPIDNPFHDGDATIIVRSIGIASVVREEVGFFTRRNAAAIFEARFRRRLTFDLDAPVILHGRDVQPAAAAIFEGDGFLIQGFESNPGIGTVDPDLSDGRDPVASLRGALSREQRDNIVGEGLPVPSIRDITPRMAADRDKALILDAAYLRDYVSGILAECADGRFAGPVRWTEVTAPDLGSFNPALPAEAAGQNPMLTFVDGDLSLGGAISGAGLLVVTGSLEVTGAFSFYGLILVAGRGSLTLDMGGGAVTGGVYVAGLGPAAAPQDWGVARLTVKRGARVLLNRDAIRLGIDLMPPAQIGIREVLSTMDP